jgi:hypothetical protein
MPVDYLCFAGSEIANNCATVAYARGGYSNFDVRDCGCCEGFALGALETEFSTPAGDNQPWIDAKEPDSADFAGLLITDITGLDTAPFERTVIDVVGGGAVLGRGRYGARTIVVTGVLIGGSCCAVDYGLRWLASALRGSCDTTTGSSRCAGDDLIFYTCCPEVCEDAPGFTTVQACFAPYKRTLHRVALTSGPEIIATQGTGCGCCQSCPVQTVQFTLTAGEPYAYSDPMVITEATALEPMASDCPVWVKVPKGTACAQANECADPPDCALDPLCPQPVAPPSVPTVFNPCSCIPLERSTACVNVPANTISVNAEGVPIIEVFAGMTALRNVVVQIFTNPQGLPADQLDPCSACSTVTVAYIPPSGTLTLDGTTKKATITCPGSSPTPANTIIGGANQPFSWPTFDCGGVMYTVCVTAATASVSPNTKFSLRVVQRDT